jgi:hypothetical protein
MIRWRCWRWRLGIVGRVDCGSKAYRYVGLLCCFGKRRISAVDCVRGALGTAEAMANGRLSGAGDGDYFCAAHDDDRGISRLVVLRMSGGGLLIVGVYGNGPRHEFLAAMGAMMGKVFLSVRRLSMENSTRLFLRLRRNGAGGDGGAIETKRRASVQEWAQRAAMERERWYLRMTGRRLRK